MDNFKPIIFERKEVPFTRNRILRSPPLVVPHILMGSYLYYIHNESLFSDEDYDWMCRFLLERFDDIEHPHKKHITKEQLLAGSLYDVPAESYPTITKNVAFQLLYSWHGRLLDGCPVFKKGTIE